MKELVNQWFEQSAPFQGILACGVRHSDRTTATKFWADGFSDLAIDNALRCVADLFQVMQLNKIPPARVRWVYQQASLYCERRPDGICLGIFTTANSNDCDFAGLERIFHEFQALSKTSSL